LTGRANKKDENFTRLFLWLLPFFWLSSPDDMDIANKSLWQSSCCHISFSQSFCVLGDWVSSRTESSFVVIWVFLNYRFFFWFAAVRSDIASQQQDEIDDALQMGVLRSSGHSYLWVRFRV
jgi:hypothetical protein